MRISAPNKASVQKGENWALRLGGGMVLCLLALAVFADVLLVLCRNFVPEMLVRRVMAGKQADAALHNYTRLPLSIKDICERPIGVKGPRQFTGSMLFAGSVFSR